MALILKHGRNIYDVGTGESFHAFFSTVAANLEGRRWGSRFKIIQNPLYSGYLKKEWYDLALSELATIREEFSKLPPNRLVWDIEDRSAMPPWGENVPSGCTDLSTYFLTPGGENLFDVMEDAFTRGKEFGEDLEVTNMNLDPSQDTIVVSPDGTTS